MKTFLLIASLLTAVRGCVPCHAADYYEDTNGWILVFSNPTWHFVPPEKISVSSDEIRLRALSQVESGDDDFAVGAAGEVSRYQILPSNWNRMADLAKHIDPKWKLSAINKYDAMQAALILGNENVLRFQNRHGRPPTDFEFYKLWNPHCPDETAKRFANLCEAISRRDAEAQGK